MNFLCLYTLFQKAPAQLTIVDGNFTPVYAFFFALFDSERSLNKLLSDVLDERAGG